ncbi:MAG: PaaI family thioesterase [Desulfobacterales bacterium]
MKFYANDSLVFSEVTVPNHLCGWNNLIHGGILSTILDEIMSWAAIYLLKRITLTKSMEIEFLKPVYVEQTLKAEGKVLEIMGKHEAVMEGCLSNSDGTICTRSIAKFAIFSPAVAKRLGIANEEHISWFEHIYNLKR